MIVPELSHVEQIGDLAYFATTQGVMGVGYRLPVVDVEDPRADAKIHAIQSLMKGATPGVRYRFVNRSTQLNDLWFVSDRQKAIEQTGYLQQEITFTIEYALRRNLRDVLPFSKKRKCSFGTLKDLIPHQQLRELDAVPLDERETRSLFTLPAAEVDKQLNCLDVGSEVIGIVRLWKQGRDALSEETLAQIRDSLPLSYEIHVSIQKVGLARNELRLRSQLAKQAVSQDPTATRRTDEIVRQIEASALDGVGLVEIEWLLVFRRFSEEILRRDLSQALTSLRPLGDIMVETVGAVPSFKASLVGSPQHFSFQENDINAAVYLPIFSFGASADRESAPSTRNLVLHRVDGSLHLFDQFSPKFLAYNIIISGKTGSGKSVLANALSSSLLQDPSIHLITIDVGGSYKKECALFDGEEIGFSLNEPSGINPFAALSEISSSNEAVEVLARFLCVLLREEGETSVSRSLQTQVDEHIKAYAQSNPKTPSIDDFVSWSADFPRKELLKRWCKNGVFENALRPKTSPNGLSKRYRYYNFETIQNAASPEYSEGVMAAVIAQVNLEMIRLGSPEQHGKRLVLRVDESKFFIERNAEFFLLTTANFRKFGHGTILNVQRIQNFELTLSHGRSDAGIILNSPIRFFLEQDVEREYLKTTFQLSEDHLSALVDAPYRGKQYRQMVLQDDTGTRLVRLYLTDEEYWRVTSSKEENDKVTGLLKAVPGLTMKEAINCLAIAENG